MTVSSKLGFTLAALATLGLTAAHPADAQTTLYNFQAGDASGTQGPTYTGVGVLSSGAGSTSIFNREGYVGGATNQIGGGNGTVLDSQGNAATGVTFKYDAQGFTQRGSDATTTDAAAFLQTYGTTTGTADISLTGLAADTSFTAVFFGQNGTYADGRVTTFQLTNSSFQALPGASNTANTISNSATGFTTNPGNYVTFTGTTDANGGIFATYATNNTGGINEGDFTGAQFQIGAGTSPVPEASSSVGLSLLLALGGLVLIARKRNASLTSAA